MISVAVGRNSALYLQLRHFGFLSVQFACGGDIDRIAGSIGFGGYWKRRAVRWFGSRISCEDEGR